MLHGKINQTFRLIRGVDCSGRVVGCVEDDGLGVLVDVGLKLVKIRMVVVPPNRYVDG